MKFIPKRQIIHDKKLYSVGGSYEILPSEKDELKEYGIIVEDVVQEKDNEAITKKSEVEKLKSDNKTTAVKRGRPKK